jgi:hypothetical protein
VINSIHSIEEANVPSELGRIRISIQREPLTLFDSTEDRRVGSQPVRDVAGFTVVDNGIGFNDENFDAFLTLDTDHKVSKGGRGIGRLLWLKAFHRVEVQSVFAANARLFKRTFDFSNLNYSSWL